MEKVILDAFPVLGPPALMVAVIVYYFVKQTKAGPRPDVMDDVRDSIEHLRQMTEENHAAIKQMRDWILILKDREERG